MLLAVAAPSAVSCGAEDDGGIVVDTAGGDAGVDCGNGTVEEGEECDGSDDCTPMCTIHECGDALLGPGEKCDDGNDADGDACTSSCELGPDAIVDIALAEYYTCAVSLSSRVKCWGSASNGRLGQVGYSEHIGDDEHPSDWDDVPVADDVVELVAGREHVCALRESGGVICWGYNSSRQLGYGHDVNVGFDESPADAGNLAVTDVAALAAGNSHTCALGSGGDVTCWGSGGSGRLGYGNDSMSTADGELAGSHGPVALPGAAVQIAAGADHTCARLEGGDVVCWGNNSNGQLGTGNPDNVGEVDTPAGLSPIDLGGKAVDIDAGNSTTCAVLEDGGVRCWGANNSGQLGNGESMDVGDRKTPAEDGVVMFEGEAQTVRLGSSHACVTADDGKIYCWGSRDKLGYSGADQRALPGPPVSLGVDASHVEVGFQHSCAITASAGVRCWGDNTGFKLGDPEVGGSTSILDPSMNPDVEIF